MLRRRSVAASLWISGAEMQHENKGAGLRSRAHPADEGLEPAASSGRVFLLDPADAEAR
jgi:hypothetical protein